VLGAISSEIRCPEHQADHLPPYIVLKPILLQDLPLCLQYVFMAWSISRKETLLLPFTFFFYCPSFNISFEDLVFFLYFIVIPA
jgi:hypothetical protein